MIGIKFMLGDTKTKPAQETTYADLVDHIDHMVSVVGIDHVAIGTDFTAATDESVRQRANEKINFIRRQFPGRYKGQRQAPAGFSRIQDLPNITGELVRRGYTDPDMEKLLGGNWIRVLTDIFNQGMSISKSGGYC